MRLEDDGGGKTDARSYQSPKLSLSLSFRLEVLPKVDCYAIDMISGMIAIVVGRLLVISVATRCDIQS